MSRVTFASFLLLVAVASVSRADYAGIQPNGGDGDDGRGGGGGGGDVGDEGDNSYGGETSDKNQDEAEGPPIDHCIFMKCSQGFVCKNGKCQKLGDTCSLNEYSTACGPCPPEQTCQDALNGTPPPTICSDLCRSTPACFCSPGFFRINGKCVSKQECAQKPIASMQCGKNEHSTHTLCPPEQTCQDALSNVTVPKICSKIFLKNPICSCLPGFYRENGNCVSRQQCSCGPNEVVPPCIPCVPEKTCSNVQDPIIDSLHCTVCRVNHKCYCGQGFVRNDEGNCVPKEECRNPGGVCGPNEVSAACSACPPEQTCQDAIHGTPAPNECSLICRTTPSCYCEDGFFRSDNGECVAADECMPLDRCALIRCREGFVCKDGLCTPVDLKSHLKVCGKNESIPVCKPCGPEKSCGDALNPDYHQVMCRQSCRPNDKCYCDPGFVRDHQENCVLEAECDIWDEPTCGPNEYIPKCEPCEPEKTCEDAAHLTHRPPRICSKICKSNSRAYCKPGFFRNLHGECVHFEECVVIPEKLCDKLCVIGDVCKNGECVPLQPQPPKSCTMMCTLGHKCLNDKCVPIYGPNEEVPACIPCEPDKTCEDIFNPNPAPPKICPKICRPNKMAYCKRGFYLLNEVCVPEDYCRQIASSCGPNEEKPACGHCGPEKTCEDALKPNPKPLICHQMCRPSDICVCKQGFFRLDGDCVAENVCKTDYEPNNGTCGPNEYVPKCEPCEPEKTCEDAAHPTPGPPRICSKICKNNSRAYCEPGFFRNLHGECVQFEECVVIPEKPCTMMCVLGYKCLNDKCVPIYGPNEEVPACIPCEPDKTCEDIFNPNPAPPKICPKICRPNKMAYCKRGFYLLNEVCVPEDYCRQIASSCGPNEEKPACGTCGPEKTCEDALKPNPKPIICSQMCRPSDICVCKQGFFRLDGDCVAENVCKTDYEPNNGPNGLKEYVPECKPCEPEKNCSDAANAYPSEPRNCTYSCIKNTRSYCKDGLFRNTAGECVASDQCPQTGTVCVNGNCVPKKPCIMMCMTGYECQNGACVPIEPKPRKPCDIICMVDHKCQNGECVPIKPPPPTDCSHVHCQTGMFCVNGTCIPNKPCTMMCTLGYKCLNDKCVPIYGPNEEVPACIPCEPDKTCEDIFNPNPAPPKICPKICRPNKMAYCKRGFYRLNEVCVPEDYCRKIALSCGPNEEKPACGHCGREKTCEDALKPNPKPLICHQMCRPSDICVCKQGFFRLDGDCVAENVCKTDYEPNNGTCGPNEYVPKCEPCEPEKTCEDAAHPTPGPPRICSKICKNNSRAYCEPGFFRNLHGECVQFEECVVIPEKPCTMMCVLGYKCLNDKCVPIYGPNEEVPACIPCEPEKTCEDMFKPNPAPPKMCPMICRPNTMAYCKRGFYRLNEVCVPEEYCRQIASSCGPNEEKPACGHCGREKTCEDALKPNPKPIICHQMCRPSDICVCKQGFFRLDGDCVAENVCKTDYEPNNGTYGSNEYVPECKPCEPEKNCSDAANAYPREPRICTDICIKNTRSYCKDGLFRNTAGECVASDQCPQTI